MANNYQTVSEKDLGAGIDARSSENALEPGYAQDILNGDVIERRIRKRSGYQGYAGCLPIRINEIEYTTDLLNNIKLVLDASIDLANIPTTPVIIYGRTSSQNTLNEGSFPNDANGVQYFPAFTANPRVTFLTGTNTLSLSQGEHGFNSALLFVGVSQSLSTSDFSNETFQVTEIRIDQSTYDIEIDYTNSGSEFDGFVYFSDKQAVSGETYIGANTVVGAGATSTITISAGTHALNTFNIISRLYQDTGTDFVSITPNTVILNPTTGQVAITLTNSTASPITVFPILTTTPLDNISTGSVAVSASATITIPNFSGIFPILGVYLEQTLNGPLEEVIPDSVSYDAATNDLSVTFTNNSLVSANFKIYWDTGSIITNQLFLTDTTNPVTANFTDTRPQLTMWGICHDDIYTSSEAREGWVNHIDTYRRPLEERLVAGLGGNLFAARTIDEIGTEYLLPQVYPALNNRVDIDTVIGPLFHADGATPARSRGYITGSNVGANWARVESITWNSGTGYADYILSIEDLAILDSSGMATSISSVISTAANEEDYLTIQGTGYSIHAGTFRITSVAQIDASHIRISVDNANLFLSDYNETDSGALAAVFTDQLTLLEDSGFIPGDIITSQLFDEESIISVITSSIDTVVLSGVVDLVDVPLGLRLQGERTSSIIPMRDSTGASTVENLLAGDTLGYSAIARLLQVKYANTASARTVSINGDASTSTATVTLTSGDTSDLSVGNSVLLLYAGSYTGTQVITEVLSSTSFTFTSSLDDNETGTIPSNYIEIDESLNWSDESDNSNYFSVNSRWIPIEAPTDNWNLTPSTYVHHLSGEYTDQPFLRSVMVNDNMYFVNGQDEVMKFDGENIYRAGLPRWQTGVFLTLDNTGPGLIVTDTPTAALIAPFIDQNQFILTSGDESKYLIGQRIHHDDGSAVQSYVITAITEQNTTESIPASVTVDRVISGAAAGSITGIATYRYYYRLNAVDANDNIVASAVVGSENTRVDVSEDTAIHHQLIGFPIWDNYDYDRLEVEIYRTVSNTPAPFYRITNIPLGFNQNNGYLHFVDTVQDAELQDQTQLDITSGIVGGEVSLQTTWNEPIRAKYLTSVGNRLVLANLTDYPELDIQLNDQGNLASNANLNGFIWSFRRDNTQSGAVSSTDMINTARYQWINAATATPATISAVTPAAGTVTFTIGAHSLVAGNWIYTYHAAKGATNSSMYCGWHQINSVTATTVVVNYQNNLEAGTVNRLLTATAPTDIPVLIGADGNRDTRSDRNSSILRPITDAVYRLSQAINCSMRVVNTTLPAYEAFTPWLIANAGDEYQAGQLVIRQPRVDATPPEVVLPASIPADFDIFIGNLRRAANSQVSATEAVFTSRVIQSYPNFPEIFENPLAVSEENSDQIRDINSADGQELTGIIPFFSESIASASQKEGVVLAFKSSSIYLFSTAISNEAQRLETQGLGCTAPFSIAPSRNSVAFANDSGIYRINRDLQMEYMGEKMERNWLSQVDRNNLDLVQATNFALGRQYKLSVPIGAGASANSEVYVYDHSREGQTWGAWSRYDNHPSTGWANTKTDSYFAATSGQVFQRRNTGLVQDFRDDASPITFISTMRAMDFGDPGSRKSTVAVISQFRQIANSTNSSLAVSTELSNNFEETDPFVLSVDEGVTNLSDIADRSVISIRSAVNTRNFNYIQLQYSNDGIDEPMEIAGFSFRVGLLNERGIQEARDTGSRRSR